MCSQVSLVFADGLTKILPLSTSICLGFGTSCLQRYYDRYLLKHFFFVA